MLYPRSGVRKDVLFIICSLPKTYPFIYSNNHSKQQREVHMYSYTSRMSLICTRSHPYVTFIWFYHEPKKRARNKSTFISTIHVQNVTKLKENFLNNLFQYFSNFFHISLGYRQFHLRVLSKHLKAVLFLLMYDIFLK